MKDLTIQTVKLTDIRVYKNNPKLHNKAQVAKIRESIRKFGFINPVLLDENMEIIAEHGRVAAATEAGMTDVPAIILSHLTDAQKRAYRIADNKLTELGKWSVELLKLELEKIESSCEDMDLSVTGFDSIELDTMFNADTTKAADAKTNAVPYIPENEIITRPDDIWQIGPHRIICGNSLDTDTFTNLMGNDLADMILQDPPFNVPVNGHVCGAGTVKHKEFVMASGEMSPDEFTEFLRQNFALCAKFSRSGALHYNFMDWRHKGEIVAAGRASFTDFINMCVWVKSSGGMGSLYRSQHELCFIFRNGKVSHTNNVELGRHGRYRTNVWQYAGVNAFGRHKGDIRMHPTVKPVEMLQDAILDVTRRGEIVLDSFLGSGSTLIAAHKAHRICRGIEYEPLYIDTTIRRFQNLFGIDAVHIQSGKTYNELLKAKGEINE